MLWNELYAYWKSKHVDGKPPSRAAIDPIVEIPRLVSNLLLIDKAPEGYRYRLLGSELARRSGLDLTGKLVGSTGLSEQIALPWRTTVTAAFEEQRPQLVLLHVAPQRKAEVLLLLLPLVASTGETEMLLVGAFSDEPLEPPFRVADLQPVDISLS